jgi:cyanophycinase
LVYGHSYPYLAPGLGLSNRIVVAGHFQTELHANLLRMAVASNPYLIGIGLPDAGAVIRRADTTLEVVGLADVVVVDGQEMSTTNLAEWQPGQPFEAPGLRTLTVPTAHRFDLETRQVLPPEVDLPPPLRYAL